MAAKTAEQKAAEKALKDRSKKLTKLEELGVQVTGEESDEALDELLKENAPKGAESEDSVDIVKNKNQYIRTFSLELHGEDYEDLAKEFVEHYPNRGYEVVPSSTVVNLGVNYREKEDFELPRDKQDPNKGEVDKFKAFTDKDAALAFAQAKKATVRVMTKAVEKKKK